MDFDLVIANGTIVDGTGQPRFRGDLGITDGRITAIARGQQLDGRQTIDATGLVVAPGFIDLHSHSDWIVPLADHDEILAPFVLQGITTIVGGNCGFSPAPITDQSIPLLDSFSEMLRERAFPYNWRSFAEFLDTLERDGLFLNAAFLVGHGTLRYAVVGDRSSAPSPSEMEALCQATRWALQEGAFGISTGLSYAPGIFADNQEVSALLRAAAECAGLHAVHARCYQSTSPFYQVDDTPHNVLSNREQLELARQTGVRLQLSHLIFNGRRAWPTYRTVLQDIERAAEEGVDVAFDAFPYTVGNTTINILFPAWFLDGFAQKVNDRAALKRLESEIAARFDVVGRNYSDFILLWCGLPELAELEGQNFATIARRLGMSEFEAYTHVARLTNGGARILHGPFSGDWDYEEPLQAVLAHPLCAFMADTILTKRGKQNPASFGTWPRLLGRYARDLKLFSLEETVRRMTSFPAERLGLADTGRIAEKLWADLVVFDPVKVADNTTRDQFDVPPSGIDTVVISGQVVARQGEIASHQRPGRVLRH